MSTTHHIGRERLAGALVACARELLAAGAASAPPDLALDLAADEGLRLGDYLMDSLGFVEWMVELEEQLDVPVMDFADSDEARTLGGLADAVLRRAQPELVDRFCERWADSSRVAR